MVIWKFSSVWGKNVYNVLQQNNNIKERYSVGRDCAMRIAYAIAAKLLIFFLSPVTP